ncbi:MAG: hypothetical protein WC696_06150 [Candidatus Methylopumilus sp.]|jgi:hypothetical protein
MKKHYALTMTTITLLTIFNSTTHADETNDLNKRMLRPGIGVQSQTIQPAQAAPIVNNPGVTQSLNPQPFPPAENAATKIAPATINNATGQGLQPMQPMTGQLPAPTNNMNGQSAGLPVSPLRPVGDIKPGTPGAIGTSRLSDKIGTPAPVGSGITLGGAIDAASPDAFNKNRCNGAPCILAVDGQPLTQASFTPGLPGKTYKITGWGFGNNSGEVFLYNDFPTAPKFRPVPGQWKNTEISVTFDSYVGAVDQNAQLVIHPSGATNNITTPAVVKFIATRDTFSIPFEKIPKNMISLESGELFAPSYNAADCPQLNAPIAYCAYVNFVREVNQIASIKRPFTDKISLAFLKPGFKVTNVDAGFGRVDTNGSRCDGNNCGAGSGNVEVFGSYGYEIRNSEIVITRAVWHNHKSPNVLKAYKGGDEYFSGVQKLNVVVEGPKGVNPVK